MNAITARLLSRKLTFAAGAFTALLTKGYWIGATAVACTYIAIQGALDLWVPRGRSSGGARRRKRA